MTLDEFMDVAMEVSQDYLPSVKKADRKAFINALFAEMLELGLVDFNTGNDEDWAGNPDVLFDDPEAF